MTFKRNSALPKSRGLLWAAAVAVIAASAGEVAHAQTVVGGVTPSERPKAAPVVKEIAREAGWQKWSARGVSEPWPPSLKFLANQGLWYTPFDQKGMPGRYDIRGMHSMPGTKKAPRKSASAAGVRKSFRRAAEKRSTGKAS